MKVPVPLLPFLSLLLSLVVGTVSIPVLEPNDLPALPQSLTIFDDELVQLPDQHHWIPFPSDPDGSTVPYLAYHQPDQAPSTPAYMMQAPTDWPQPHPFPPLLSPPYEYPPGPLHGGIDLPQHGHVARFTDATRVTPSVLEQRGHLRAPSRPTTPRVHSPPPAPAPASTSSRSMNFHAFDERILSFLVLASFPSGHTAMRPAWHALWSDVQSTALWLRPTVAASIPPGIWDLATGSRSHSLGETPRYPTGRFSPWGETALHLHGPRSGPDHTVHVSVHAIPHTGFVYLDLSSFPSRWGRTDAPPPLASEMEDRVVQLPVSTYSRIVTGFPPAHADADDAAPADGAFSWRAVAELEPLGGRWDRRYASEAQRSWVLGRVASWIEGQGGTSGGASGVGFRSVEGGRWAHGTEEGGWEAFVARLFWLREGGRTAVWRTGGGYTAVLGPEREERGGARVVSVGAVPDGGSEGVGIQRPVVWVGELVVPREVVEANLWPHRSG